MLAHGALTMLVVFGAGCGGSTTSSTPDHMDAACARQSCSDTDAGQDGGGADAESTEAGPTPFACGSQMCGAGTYCYTQHPPDGGAVSSCMHAYCSGPGPTTCACTGLMFPCMCAEDDAGHVTGSCPRQM